MSVEAKTTWTAICDDCGKTEFHETHFSDWFGGIDEDVAAGTDFLWNLDVNEGWEVSRTAYETVKVTCPHCVRKEKEIAEFEKEQKRRKFQTAIEAESA